MRRATRLPDARRSPRRSLMRPELHGVARFPRPAGLPGHPGPSRLAMRSGSRTDLLNSHPPHLPGSSQVTGEPPRLTQNTLSPALLGSASWMARRGMKASCRPAESPRCSRGSARRFRPGGVNLARARRSSMAWPCRMASGSCLRANLLARLVGDLVCRAASDRSARRRRIPCGPTAAGTRPGPRGNPGAAGEGAREQD